MHRHNTPVLGIVLLIATLGGCTIVPERAFSPDADLAGEVGVCTRLFADLDEAVGAAGVRDGGSFPVAGFPYLRADRFLASFADEVDDRSALHAWIGRMQAMDRAARAIELKNLAPGHRERLGPALETRLLECGDQLRSADLARPERLASLQSAVVVPDEYIEWQRVAGLYPITHWFVLSGVEAWHAEARRNFRYGPIEYPRQALYVPPSAPSAVALADISQDPLGIPQFSEPLLERLFAVHAPIWQVAQQGEFDRIGRPLPGAKAPDFDSSVPLVYRRLSFTRFEGRVLPQLNYWIWFPERPSSGGIDILAGRLDSVILRITLDSDGRPLLYDSIHGCGCWHQFFPTARLAPREPPPGVEPPLIFGPAPEPNAGERLVVALASATHYIDALDVRAAHPQSAVVYALRKDHELLSMPGPAGSESLFEPSGIVPGSERLERYVLWPMALPEPGATRQWGRHATAFVGERHFDDPDLIQRLFRRAR